MRSILIFALAGGLLGSGIAYTQAVSANPEPQRPIYLPKFDEKFKAADKDNDGTLTKAETQAAGLHRIVENFDRMDANKDGKLTREETLGILLSRISS